jgi:hypothetical protein
MSSPEVVPQSWSEFVERFRTGWSDPEADEFVALFKPVFAEDAILIQPLAPTAMGRDGMERVFRTLFKLIPEISSQVVRWGASEDAVFIEGVITAKVGRREVKINHCDRFLLTLDGIVTERFAFFDPLPLIGAFLRSPSTWPRLLRARRP